jgi:hypothetical protein
MPDRIWQNGKVLRLPDQEHKLLGRYGSPDVFTKLVPVAQFVFHIDKHQIVPARAPQGTRFADIGSTIYSNVQVSHSAGSQLALRRRVHQKDLLFLELAGYRFQRMRFDDYWNHTDTVFDLAAVAGFCTLVSCFINSRFRIRFASFCFRSR